MTQSTPDLTSRPSSTRPTLVELPFETECDTEPYGLRGEPMPFEIVDTDELPLPPEDAQ